MCTTCKCATTIHCTQSHPSRSKKPPTKEEKSEIQSKVCVHHISNGHDNANILRGCCFFFSSILDENEALSTLKVAMELRLQGKMDKALRLYQHALALAPKHPEVLNKYGEYLEHSNSDIISADQMYFQVGLWFFFFLPVTKC